MKPGIQTSEFKVAALLLVLLAALLAVAVYHHNAMLAGIAVGGKAVVSVGYGISRSITKTLGPAAILFRLLGAKNSTGESPMQNDPIGVLSTKIGATLAKPLNLSASEQLIVNGGIDGVFRAGIVLGEKAIAVKFPGAATVLTDLVNAFVVAPAPTAVISAPVVTITA